MAVDRTRINVTGMTEEMYEHTETKGAELGSSPAGYVKLLILADMRALPGTEKQRAKK